MEGNMVINSAQECIEIIDSFFRENLPNYSLVTKWVHAPYWHIGFEKEDIKIQIDGDRAFNIYIYIYGSKYSLWQYDRSVNNRLCSKESDVLYQLNVLKRFLCSL